MDQVKIFIENLALKKFTFAKWLQIDSARFLQVPCGTWNLPRPVKTSQTPRKTQNLEGGKKNFY